MRRNILTNQSGFSIIEVLIGATVFMIGFGALVLMLNNVFAKFSIEELQVANVTSQKVMAETILAGDTIPCDSSIVCSGLRLNVKKTVIVEENLARVSVSVFRESTGKRLVKLYNEFVIAKE